MRIIITSKGIVQFVNDVSPKNIISRNNSISFRINKNKNYKGNKINKIIQDKLSHSLYGKRFVPIIEKSIQDLNNKKMKTIEHSGNKVRSVLKKPIKLKIKQKFHIPYNTVFMDRFNEKNENDELNDSNKIINYSYDLFHIKNTKTIDDYSSFILNKKKS